MLLNEYVSACEYSVSWRRILLVVFLCFQVCSNLQVKVLSVMQKGYREVFKLSVGFVWRCRSRPLLLFLCIKPPQREWKQNEAKRRLSSLFNLQREILHRAGRDKGGKSPLSRINLALRRFQYLFPPNGYAGPFAEFFR